MRILIAVLIGMLLFMNTLLWKMDDRGVRKVRSLQAAIETQVAQNKALKERNAALEAEVKSLKEGFAAIEERARTEMGMIRKDETFYHILEEDPGWTIPTK
jgi:cell division protein FtsB